MRRNKKLYFVCLKEVIQVKQQKDRDHTFEGNLTKFKKQILEDFGNILKEEDNDKSKSEGSIPKTETAADM